MRCAVYVEGKAEMLFVADVLCKYSNYDPKLVGFRCINLNSDVFQPINHPSQGDDSAAFYYQIVNVNNDKRVISKLKQDIPNLVKKDFKIIIGLRDVYGSDYDAISSKPREIDCKLIAKMHKAQSEQIRTEGVDTRLHFAIMEYETWMMALLDNYIVFKGKNPEKVFEASGVDCNSDFENTVYHPYDKVQKIFNQIGAAYGKHEDEDMSFLSKVRTEDYETLRNSGRCASFKSFIESLLPEELLVA